MATLYLDRKHLELRVKNRRLEVRQEGTLLESIPLLLLERVVVTSPVETDTRSLAALANAGIAVALLHGRRPLALASVTGLPGNDARRRLAQYAAWHDLEKRQQLVRDLLDQKLIAQLRWLSRLIQARPDCRRELSKAQKTLHEQHQQLVSGTTDLTHLRGIEGAAAAAGFRALRVVLPASLGFTARRRRPPPDPVNVVLSLSFTLAYGLALEAAFAAGFDPAIGFLHEPLHGRKSLASDLMEPLRPRIEAFTWTLFRDRRLTDDHFTQHNDGCLLGKAGRAVFYAAWEQHAPAWRRWLRRFSLALVHRLQELDTLPTENPPQVST